MKTIKFIERWPYPEDYPVVYNHHLWFLSNPLNQFLFTVASPWTWIAALGWFFRDFLLYQCFFWPNSTQNWWLIAFCRGNVFGFMTNFNPGYKICKTTNSINTLETNSYQSIKYENVFFVFYLLFFYCCVIFIYLADFVFILCKALLTKHYANPFLRLKSMLKF